MVNIMTIGLTDQDRIKELTVLYLSKEKPAYPDYLKKINNWAAGVSEGKYRTIAVYECAEEKLYQAMVALTMRYNFYASKGGYSFEVTPLMDQADAMKIVQGK